MIGRVSTLVGLALLTLALSEAAPARAQEEDGAIVLERGIGQLDLGERRVPLAYSRTPTGPLFTLHPIVARLGGDLEIGPLGDSHELTLGSTTYVFGPGSAAITVGDEIVRLSQAPRASIEGLEVPLDLLATLYTEATGHAFSWNPAERLLTVARRPSRQVGLQIDAVTLQDVTTIVLQFSEEPRYRLSEDGRNLRVQLLGDRLDPTVRVPQAPRLQSLDVGPAEIVLRLAAGTGSDHYLLRAPFRIVFELFPQATPLATDTAPALPPRRTGPPTIVIDPGHGGSDTGAIGPGGTQEKTLTLRLARLLADSLRRRLPVRVVLTRDEDAELPLPTRSALANQIRADLFLSIHLNSSHGSSAHGSETYFLSLEASDARAAEAAEAANSSGPSGDTLADLQLILWDMSQSRHLARSQQLANLIQEELNQALGLRDRGVKQAPFTVLMGAAMPAVLVELGFLSNPQEEERLQDPTYQRELTDALVRAVLRFRAREGSEAPAPATSQPQ